MPAPACKQQSTRFPNSERFLFTLPPCGIMFSKSQCEVGASKHEHEHEHKNR